MPPSESPAALVIHDGELGDVCSLLGRMGTRYAERCGPSTEADETRVWDIVISTPRRLLEFESSSGVRPPRIAILEKESRTLRSMLHRAGVDLLVRRPVHPEALRLLVLHTLYRGPEKRRSLRVSVGGRVRYRCGIRRRMAVLAELSETGCRLLASDAVERGDRIQVQIPADVTHGRALSVGGSIVRCGGTDQAGVHALAVSWGRQSGRVGQRLREVVAAYSDGPAMLEAREALDAQPVGPAETRGPERTPVARPPSPRERRASERREYPRHVIALGVEAARVLLGRDISLGGMRVEPHPDVRLGDELTVGLHVRAREKPLVVRACVARDEGADGLVLQWQELSPEAGDALSRMVELLPVLATRQGTDEGTGIVVSEILAHRPSEG